MTGTQWQAYTAEQIPITYGYYINENTGQFQLSF